MPFIQTKGPPVGVCNICGTRGRLTADHVPPKGVIRFNRVQLNRLAEALNASPERGRTFQRGVKFRSLCEKCNESVLGANYDPELIRFSNSISRHLHAQVDVPTSTFFSIKPGYVARSVIGHILAIGIERFPRGEMGDALAAYVLDPSAPVPADLGIYYWLYPYWDHVSIRTCGLLVHGGAPPLVVSVLKFTPLAFMLTWKADAELYFPHVNLVDYILGDGANDVEVPLDFQHIPPQRYPEAPGEHGAVFVGEDAYVAMRRRK